LFFPTHGDPSDIQTADLNGDNKPDLVAVSTNFNDPLSVLLERRRRNFPGAQAYDVGPGTDPGLVLRGKLAMSRSTDPDLRDRHHRLCAPGSAVAGVQETLSGSLKFVLTAKDRACCRR